MADWSDLWSILSPLLVGAGLVGLFALFLVHTFTDPVRRFARVYRGLDVATRPAAGRVHVVFHTYDGFLAWFTQTRHEAYLPPDQARLFLNRSVRYTLTWGLLCAGALFVLPLTLFNYLAQRRSISRQELDAAFQVSPDEPTQLDVVEFVDE